MALPMAGFRAGDLTWQQDDETMGARSASIPALPLSVVSNRTELLRPTQDPGVCVIYYPSTDAAAAVVVVPCDQLVSYCVAYFLSSKIHTRQWRCRTVAL
uniref:Uncharacterized protein n=1 Tax=Plectus sambesii TaxID=2011161 RepID=A0A914VX98_9BILA